MKKKLCFSWNDRVIPKIDLKMRLTFILLFISLLNINASTYSQNTKISMKLTDVTVEKVFAEIREKTDFKLLFVASEIDLSRIVTLNLRKKRVEKILDLLFEKTNISYEIVDKQIVLAKKITPLLSNKKVLNFSKIETPRLEQEIFSIKGTVSDEGGLLPGVSILVIGTAKGTETDFDGNFAIKVKKGDVLQFSYIGMKTFKKTINNANPLNIILESDAADLDEVVLVGFGYKKKSSIVGAISTVRPSDLKVPVSNLTTALAGRVSGVVAYQRSGEPGADNAQFFIRGVTTFADGAVPLILIDGVELTVDDLARLHPDDIEAFSILKDASTTAVYGARGANGVVYVTTKKGVIGKPKVSVRYENSVSQNTQLPAFADALTYMRLANEAVTTRRPEGRVPYSEERILSTKQGLNNNVFPTTNWQEELLRDLSMSQRFNFNVSGGGKVAQYFVSAGYSHDGGLLRESSTNDADNNVNLDRFLLRSNISINLGETTKATIRLQSTLDNLTGPAVPGDGSPGANLFARALQASPVRFPAVYDTDEANRLTRNVLFGNARANFAGAPGAFFINPYAELVSGFTRSSSAFTLLQVELNQDLKGLLPGLSVRFLGNSNRTSSFFNSRASTPFWYNASETNYDRFNNTYTLSSLNPQQGDRTLSFYPGDRRVSNVVYGELAINYVQNFNDKHDVSALLVGIARQATDGNANGLQLSLPSRNIGISGRASYGYDNKYFAEFGFGYNGSERFAKKKRFGFFPSVGLGWTISQEPFFEKFSETVNDLKIRGSYGIVGNDKIGNDSDRFFYLSEVDPRSGGRGYTFGRDFDNRSDGVSIIRYPNEDIIWEIGTKSNLGIDLSLFNNAVKIKADYFTETRKNILITRQVPLSLGLQAATRANLGVAKTSGIDASLEVNHYFNDDFWISSRANFTFANGKVTEFEEEDFAARGAPHRSILGSKINQQFGYIAERLFVDEEDVRNSPTQNFGEVQAGDIKYSDINSDGVINDLDRVPIGKPTTPQVTYGFGLSLGYKNFDFSAFFQGIAETSLFIDPFRTAPFRTSLVQANLSVAGAGVFPASVGESPLLQAYANDYWSEDNRNSYALYPRLSNGAVNNNAQTSTWWLRDGSFMRLKQAELGFTLRTDKNSNFGNLESLRFYLTGTNLLKWSKFKLWDPEVGGNGFGYPLQRVFNFGILAKF